MIVNNYQHDFFHRSVAARMTWARHSRVFYVVTGASDNSNKVYSSDACTDLTNNYQTKLQYFHTKPTSYSIYQCGKSEQETILFLHLPHCVDEYWGPKGPCCRCEGAILFYTALYKQHMAINKHKINSQLFPNWFVFADDDYYMRLGLLASILKNPMTPPTNEYSLVTSCGFDDFRTIVNSSYVVRTERQNFGLFQKDGCRVPCLHRTAVRKM